MDRQTQIPKYTIYDYWIIVDSKRGSKKELLYFLIEEIVTKDLVGRLLLSTEFESVVLYNKHVMYQLSNNATTIKQIQGYSSILNIMLDMPMFELLTVISWSSSYASSQHLDCQSFRVGFGSGENSTIFRFMLSSPVLDLPDI